MAMLFLATAFAFVFWALKDSLPHTKGQLVITTGSPKFDLMILCILGAIVTDSTIGTVLRRVYRRRFLEERDVV